MPNYQRDAPAREFLSRPLLFLLGILIGVLAYRGVDRLFPERVSGIFARRYGMLDHALLAVAALLVGMKIVARSLQRLSVTMILAIAGLIGLILGFLYVYNLSH